MSARRARAWWLLLACLLLPGALAAQTLSLLARPQPREVTVADGLPSSTITAMAEDRSGYLWLASADGLARFDGRDFRLWRTEDGLRDNFVWSLHVDAANQLWVGTRNAGLVRFSPDRRQLRHLDRSTHPLLGSNTIFAITSTADGMLWFGTDSAGLYRLDPSNRLTRFLPEPGNPRALPSPKVTHLLVDRDGALWVGTEEGVVRWNGSGFEALDMHLLADRRVNSLRLDQHGQIWIGTPDGALVRGRDGAVRRPGLQPAGGHRVLQMLIQDRRGEYWFDTTGPVVRSSDGMAAEPVEFFSSVAEDRVSRTVSFVHEDRDGGLWFSMLDGGLWHLPANWRQFVQVRGRRDVPGGLHNPRVEAMAPSSRGGLWVVGTAGDLDHLDPLTGRVEHLLDSGPGSLWIRSVMEDPQGRLWMGRNSVLERYDPRTGELRRWRRGDAQDSALLGAVRRMAVCADGTLWLMSGEGGLQRRDLDGRVLWASAGSAHDPGSNEILDLGCGPDREPWIATRGGVLRWQPAAARFAPVPGSPATAVHVFGHDRQGVVWLGELGALAQYRWRDGRLEQVDRIDARQGFPAVIPGGVVADAHGILWVTSRRGLLRIDPPSRSVRLFGVRDGLRSQEFVHGVLGLTPDGQLFSATDYGVVLVDHDEFFATPRRPPLVIEKVAGRQGDDLVDLTHDSPLEIPHGMRDVQVTARLLSFSDAANATYRFRLEGYDHDWVEVGNSGQRLFSRLEPGSHRLLVQARTPDQLWSEVHELELRVRPPWWKSVPGLLLFGLGAGGLLLVGLQLYRRRLRRLSELALARTRRELAEQASEAKTRFLANFGHEVRTPLTGVLGMSELLLGAPLRDREHGYARAIQQAGEHLLRLVNDALDLARIEAGKLELRMEDVALQPLLDQAMELMSPLARQKGLLLSQPVRLADTVLARGDVLRLRQIALNLIGNAIKFTARGSVTVSAGVAEGGRGVWLEVLDTGPGMSEEQQKRLFGRFEQADGALTTQRYGGSGLGLAISQELAMAMGGRITVRSRLGEGACFRVALPLEWRMAVAEAAPRAAAADGLPPLRVLLVEDDHTVGQVISGLLRERGHEVVHVPHGLAALAELVRATFDIGLLDLDLPGMDGLALAGQIRHMGLRLPLLAVTARTDAADGDLVEAAGFQGLLRKPVSGQALLQAMAGVLGRGREPAQSDGAGEAPVAGG